MQESDREWPGALLARRTRTIRMCSSDARSRGQPWPPPPIGFRSGGVEKKKGKKGGLAIPCARATRGLRRPSLDARTLGSDQATLHCGVIRRKGTVRRPQWDKHGCPLKKLGLTEASPIRNLACAPTCIGSTRLKVIEHDGNQDCP